MASFERQHTTAKRTKSSHAQFVIGHGGYSTDDSASDSENRSSMNLPAKRRRNYSPSAEEISVATTALNADWVTQHRDVAATGLSELLHGITPKEAVDVYPHVNGWNTGLEVNAINPVNAPRKTIVSITEEFSSSEQCRAIEQGHILRAKSDRSVQDLESEHVPAAFSCNRKSLHNAKISQFEDSPFLRQGMIQDLPVWIGRGRKTRVDAIPDTGATLNIISHTTLRALYPEGVIAMHEDDANEAELRVADGQKVKALGEIKLSCSFSDESFEETDVLFHVCDVLAGSISIIFGKPFLDETETFTKRSHRLKLSSDSTPRIPRVLHLTPSYTQMLIMMDSILTPACPDTGSHIDLVSEVYARRIDATMLKLQRGDPRQIEFADGRKERLRHKILVDISIPGNIHSQPRLETNALGASEESRNNSSMVVDKSHPKSLAEPSKISRIRPFYVLPGLACHVIVGQLFLYSVDAFKVHSAAFSVPEVAETYDTLNTIFVVSDARMRWIDIVNKYTRGDKTKIPFPGVYKQDHFGL
jgi:hypothetical protein